MLSFIETTNQTDGGDDTIVAGDGNNVVLGGSGADQITLGNGANTILGDNGDATFAVALASGTVAGGNAAYSRTLTQIETTAEVSSNGTLRDTADQTAGGAVRGGDDTIGVGAGNNVIFGGLGADHITTGAGNDVVLGDSGTAIFDGTTGNLVKVFSTFGSAPGQRDEPGHGHDLERRHHAGQRQQRGSSAARAATGSSSAPRAPTWSSATTARPITPAAS